MYDSAGQDYANLLETYWVKYVAVHIYLQFWMPGISMRKSQKVNLVQRKNWEYYNAKLR